MTDSQTPRGAVSESRRTGIWLATAMAVTLLVTRAWLHWRPDTDLNIWGYNIHHLFTGVLLVGLCGIPAVLGPRSRRLQAVAVAGFGVGLSLALDEWVYLIATDGSNASYLLPVSLVPGVAMVAAACAYAIWLDSRTDTPPRRRLQTSQRSMDPSDQRTFP